MARITMQNKAPGPCVVCGETVPANEGHFIKIKGQGWKVQHGICPVVQRAHDSLDIMARAFFEASRARIKP